MVGGSEGPSSAAGVCSLMWGNVSESMQRSGKKTSNFRVWNKCKEACIGEFGALFTSEQQSILSSYENRIAVDMRILMQY